MNLIKYSKELTIDFNQRYIIQRRENHGDWKAYNQFLPKVQVESDCLFINIADMLHAIIYSQGEKPLALKILGLKINARVTFRVIAVSFPSSLYFVLMMLVKVNAIGESFPSTPSSLYAPDTEEETDNLASCSCSPNRFVTASSHSTGF